MRTALALILTLCGAQASWASPEVNRLVDAMGIPALIVIFAAEGAQSGEALDDSFLNGQGGDVWAETVRRLYDPVRLEQDMRAGMAQALDAQVAAQALVFFESDLGARIIDLEVQARRAMMNDDLEAAARSAPAANSDAVSDMLEVRNLIARNTDTSMGARIAFFEGLARVTGGDDTPDLEAQRDSVRAETESWLRGYTALAQSPLSADEVAIYTAFWDTEVGAAVDDALFEAFGTSYATLSYGLGQAVGRLLPQNDL